MMKLLIFILVCALPLLYAAPTINKSLVVIEKREDSADRKQASAIGGAASGIAVPNIFGIIPQHPLGGQANDED
ncbi:hypothetical protein INT46_000313 [Mucor plumbeus]|uniref:Uncharacterized protein n=1 Tax=Mucor plumbeus TaxID=97098 RepID=A0A8H7V872_9FUNG|nr:hypothetical protein INT46_000313 [Mucor plumbeus]